MIRQKTAVLLGFCLQAGALLGGASSNDAQKLYDLGISIGLSFQLMDDYLDSFGETAKVGKRIGGDILEKKKTYLWNEMWNELNAETKGEVMTIYSHPEQEIITFIKSKMDETGAKVSTLQKAEEYSEKSSDVLRDLNSKGDKEYLEQILEMLASRES